MRKLFRRGNLICILNSVPGESNNHLNERGKFILKQKPKTADEYNKAVLYSFIYVNYKFRGCIYNDDIMEALEAMTH